MEIKINPKSKKKENNHKLITFDTKKVQEITEQIQKGYKFQSMENPWFEGKIGIRKANVVFQRSEEETLEYAKCKYDIYHFAEKYCKIKREDGSIGTFQIRDYQKDIIDLYTQNQKSILMASRQMGKTVMAAIVILHYCLFNNDKNVLLVANKGVTTKEIISKIKNIYRNLPYFIQAGVSVWNQQNINFEDTGCTIQAMNKTTDPGVGFTIDFLYIDEFAKIEENIVRPFYRSVYPTVSNVENHKIIITSTPDGFNLFYELLMGAEKDEEDPEGNEYKPLRVYWWQNERRHVTYFRINSKKLKKYNVSKEYLMKLIKDVFQIHNKKTHKGLEYVRDEYNYDKEQEEIHIQNDEYVTVDKIRQLFIYDKNDKKIPLSKLGTIKTWREETISNIGGIENFNQEYNLRFITSSKMLFNEEYMTKISNELNDFEWKEIEELNKYLSFEYKELRWVKDRPELFHLSNAKDYNIVMSIDLAEGIGEDYSVINIFRLLPKEQQEIENSKIEHLCDFFKLEQIGLYHYNFISVKDLSELVYIIAFKIFNPDRVKIALEYNTYGETLINQMPKVFQGMNQYTSHIFLRYKHRSDSDKKKIGYKINNSNKNLMVKDFQNAMKNNLIHIHEKNTLNELTTFTKHETPSGNITFKAESGHDDICMTLVGVSTVFENNAFRSMVEEIVSYDLDDDKRKEIENHLKEVNDEEGMMIDYGVLFDAKKRNKAEKDYEDYVNASITNIDLMGNNSQRIY